MQISSILVPLFLAVRAAHAAADNSTTGTATDGDIEVTFEMLSDDIENGTALISLTHLDADSVAVVHSVSDIASVNLCSNWWSAFPVLLPLGPKHSRARPQHTVPAFTTLDYLLT